MKKPDLPPPDVRQVTGPKSREEFEEILSRGAAQALQSATNSKEYVEAVKAGIAVYEALYGTPKEDGWGTGLPGQQKNGAMA